MPRIESGKLDSIESLTAQLNFHGVGESAFAWKHVDRHELDVVLDIAPLAADDVISFIEISAAASSSSDFGATMWAMIPAHAQELDKMNGWSAKTETLPNDVLGPVAATAPWLRIGE